MAIFGNPAASKLMYYKYQQVVFSIMECLICTKYVLKQIAKKKVHEPIMSHLQATEQE